MVVVPWRRLSQAARWNGQPPHTTTGAARVRESHCQYSTWSAGTIAIATTGTVSTAETTSRCTRGSVTFSSAPVWSTGAGSAAGTRAPYPACSTVPTRSAGVTASG